MPTRARGRRVATPSTSRERGSRAAGWPSGCRSRGAPSDAVVTRSLGYPYVLALVRDLGLRGKEFPLVEEGGYRLDWPVRRLGG